MDLDIITKIIDFFSVICLEIDNSDTDSSDSDSMPWQQVWLPPDNGESCAMSERYGIYLTKHIHLFQKCLRIPGFG